ncbi:MAG: hypothetical protein ACTSRG_17590 [Candidatus Helarchaeota archaeon]
MIFVFEIDLITVLAIFIGIVLPLFGLYLHIQRHENVIKLIIDKNSKKICFFKNYLKNENNKDEYNIENLNSIEAKKHFKYTYDIEFNILSQKIIIFENLGQEEVEILWQKFTKYFDIPLIINK